MRELLLKIIGQFDYVTALEINNDQLSARNVNQARIINNLNEQLDAQKLNNEKLYANNNLILEENNNLREMIKEQIALREMSSKENEQLKRDNTMYNKQCAKFTSQLQSLRAKIGCLKRKLEKYEQTAND